MTEPKPLGDNPYTSLSAVQLQWCEQFSAHASACLTDQVSHVAQDILRRELRYDIHDDSVTLWLIWEFVKTKMREPGGPEFAAMLLAAALQRLARAPRASNPLAHLENGDIADGK
jgi:hypothetical protein